MRKTESTNVDGVVRLSIFCEHTVLKWSLSDAPYSRACLERALCVPFTSFVTEYIIVHCVIILKSVVMQCCTTLFYLIGKHLFLKWLGIEEI